MSDVFDPKDAAVDPSVVDPKTAHKAVKEIKQRLKTFAKSEKDSLKELIRHLSPAQRDALARKLAAEKAAEKLAERAAPRERSEAVLSFAQEREWFRDRMFPGIAHNIAGALRLDGPLSIEALQSTFDEIVRRHDALRAHITAPEGKPVLTIAPPSPVTIDVLETTDEQWRELYAAEMTRGFDLERDLLLRATLLRLGPERHVLLLTLHHIAADGWSIGVAMQELAELYTAFVQSRRASLPPVPMQYADFARWQRDRIDGEALRAGLAYWQQQLAGLPPVLELPPDRLRHGEVLTERDHDAATTASRVDASTRKSLEELSRGEDTTLFVTLLTAFVVLLGRCTGRDDLLVGSPVSGRTHVETERSIGLFLNTLALRVRFTPELTFRQALAIVRTTVLEALEHAEVPVERIVQTLDSDRGRHQHPLYETIFNFTPSAPRRATWGELRVELEDPPALIEEFSTQLFITDDGAALDLDLRYRAKRYTDERMACFLEQYVDVLRQIARDADRRIASLDLATPLSRTRIPDPTLPLEKPPQVHVPDAIDAWIARTPDAPAIQQGDRTISYEELGDHIGAIGELLEATGFHRGDVVAVAGPRCINVILAMAATLRAGGVLLTLSTELPEQRRQVMLEEAGARFLLRCDDSSVDFRGLRTTALHPAEEGAAYIFFTSGSTGTPKAVLGTHEGLAHWLSWQRETFDVSPADRCGQLTGLSFDVVLRDVFLALTSGATLVLPTPDDTDTLRWLEREQISLTHTVPAVAETWLIGKPADVTLAALRRVFFAGEPLTSSLVARWREAFPRAGAIVNVYGPTETTLAKCFYVVPEQPRDGVQPLGRTLPQTQAVVLTQERALCGVGEPGEIAIRTPFRSRGYLNAPDENAKRFVVNPFTGDVDDLLYLTGDRGVYGADGLLEFRGRIDQQVKVRGVRIEPMEITAALQSCPSVATCAVIARDDDGRGPMLVAYVVLAKDAREDAGALQEFVAQRLPAAMVPSAFVFLDTLPLTANQKLDRDRLPAPSSVRTAGTRYVAPRDAVELTLVQIWEELLDVRPIGVTQRFFEVGGHSLLALRLLVEVERRLGSKVPLPALFEEPTIEHLAKVVRRKDEAWPLMVTLRSGKERRKLFLVHPGGGTLLNYVHLLRHLPAGIPIHGIQARGLDGRQEPHDELNEMARDYVAELRRVQPEGPYLIAGHSFGGVIAFEMARQLEAAGEAIAFLGMFDSVAPISARGYAPEDERREDALRLASMAEGIGRFLGEPVDVSFAQLANLPAEQQIDAVVDALVRTRALPPGEEQKLIRNLLSVSKAHVRAHRTYVPQRIAAPITLFRVAEAKASDYPSSDEAVLRDDALGWTGLASASVRVVRTAGNHITMLDAAHAEGLAQLLRASLAEALESKGEGHVESHVQGHA
jgi:amino acid adenylation domain-containing protein